jgi:site-specific recombinase XerD
MALPFPRRLQLPAIDPAPLIVRCVDAEQSCELSARSLFEINLHLNRFSDYCRERGIVSFSGLDAVFLKDFILYINPSGSPAQGKAIIWTLRKFFSYFALWGLVQES